MHSTKLSSQLVDFIFYLSPAKCVRICNAGSRNGRHSKRRIRSSNARVARLKFQPQFSCHLQQSEPLSRDSLSANIRPFAPSDSPPRLNLAQRACRTLGAAKFSACLVTTRGHFFALFVIVNKESLKFFASFEPQILFISKMSPVFTRAPVGNRSQRNSSADYKRRLAPLASLDSLGVDSCRGSFVDWRYFEDLSDDCADSLLEATQLSGNCVAQLDSLLTTTTCEPIIDSKPSLAGQEAKTDKQVSVSSLSKHDFPAVPTSVGSGAGSKEGTRGIKRVGFIGSVVNECNERRAELIKSRNYPPLEDVEEPHEKAGKRPEIKRVSTYTQTDEVPHLRELLDELAKNGVLQSCSENSNICI